MKSPRSIPFYLTGTDPLLRFPFSRIDLVCEHLLETNATLPGSFSFTGAFEKESHKYPLLATATQCRSRSVCDVGNNNLEEMARSRIPPRIVKGFGDYVSQRLVRLTSLLPQKLFVLVHL